MIPYGQSIAMDIRKFGWKEVAQDASTMAKEAAWHI